MVEQLIELTRPIPSLPVHSIKYKNKTWIYVYCLRTPFELTGTPLEKPLYLRGALQALTLTDVSGNNMVLLPFFTLQDVLNLLEEQRKADLEFRADFDSQKTEPLTITISNKNHVFTKATYLVKALRQMKTKTEFIGVQHGKL